MNSEYNRILTEKLAAVMKEVYNHLELYRDKKLDVNPRELAVLLTLGIDQELRIGELTAMLNLPLSTVSWVADRMVQDGYLERLPAPYDRRAVVVRAAEKGKSVLERHQSIFQEVAASLVVYLHDSEKEAFLEMLSTIEQRLRNNE